MRNEFAAYPDINGASHMHRGERPVIRPERDTRADLERLAEPYRRRWLLRAAGAIERGNLLPAGTLPEKVEPAEDSSAVPPLELEGSWRNRHHAPTLILG